MSLRDGLIKEVLKNKVVKTGQDDVLPIDEIYGKNVFNDEAMKKYLPYAAYKKLKTIMAEGGQIDSQLAEEVAHGVKEWALSKGATHFTHWFQPMTGHTAEKHDSFLSFDSSGLPISRFSGKNLSQGEPDASSFPSGGIRSTFEARGYTAWDPTSPIFLMENDNGATICIPTVFLSYTGEALDKKTPLLRSMEYINRSALRVLKLFGNQTAKRVYSTVGPEQEYFLIDEAYYYRRPDLVLTGRTLFGAPSPKGQQLEDHYFGSIRNRVLCFMQDVEAELYKLGIPAKTRHNEVAPAQFEIAPIFEDSNIATDHNHLIMETMKKMAGKYNFALLIHEKPFAGVNGSGKHNNWSMSDSDDNNLLEPGNTPHENLQFLTFLVGTIKAVHQYSDILRASIATPGNDHRLGANEAPPAIISVFLGEQLDQILDNIENNKTSKYTDKQIIELGISKLPVISKDNTDRNRTSPFAFTGNKFEFRAVGSSNSISPANYTINTVVADVLNQMADAIDANLKKGQTLNEAVMAVLLPMIRETKAVRFEGNNYDPAWEKEAAKRGLPNKKTTPEALKPMLDKKNIDVFVKGGVFSEREIHSRYHIYVEHYNTVLNIEAKTALNMAKTIILPAVLKYQKAMAASVASLKAVDEAASKGQAGLVSAYAGLVSDLLIKQHALEKELEAALSLEDMETRADKYSKGVFSAMAALRHTVDALEEVTADESWPLPKYWEMLFVY